MPNTRMYLNSNKYKNTFNLHILGFGKQYNASEKTIHKNLQHFYSGQNGENSNNILHDELYSTILETSHNYDYAINNSDENMPINENESSLSNNIDEARHNLATRIMSNGVEVIIAGDRTKMPDQDILGNVQILQPHYHNNNKPMTLAPSTIKNQLMILLFPSSARTTDPSKQKLNTNLPFHTNHFITKTCLTTYTYRTTYIQDGLTTVESREKVISNIATEERNYPKIVASQTSGVTLTRTPELAVGIFPTTFSYFNTFKDISNELQIMTSEHTVINTVTGPNDYLAYLQTVGLSTSNRKTNTYYNEITLRTGDKELKVVKRNLTQIVITKSYVPTSYSRHITLMSNSYDGINVLNDEKVENKNNSNANKPISDLHIYSTKTLLTTLTYYTTTILNSYYTDKTIQDVKPLSTIFNYYTRVIENVITNSLPASLLPSELINRMRIELKQQKQATNSQNRLHNIITTLATLNNGETVKISAIKPVLEISPMITSMNSLMMTTTLDYNPVMEENEDKEIVETNNNHNVEQSSSQFDEEKFSTGENFKQPYSQYNDSENFSLLTLPSEPIAVVVEPPESNTKFSTISNEKLPSSSANTNKLIQRLTALKPVFNAMADLWQNNFGVNMGHGSSTQAPNNKMNVMPANKQNLSIDTHPIYIPVQNSPLNSHLSYPNTTNLNEFVAQSLHIQPPLMIKDEKVVGDGDRIQRPPSSQSSVILRQQQPLHNGGIYIRPGEIITANSDVIVGKPNGIEYVHIRDQMNDRKNISKETTTNTLNNRQYPFVTYYQNKIQHTYKPNIVGNLASPINKHKPWHLQNGGGGGSNIESEKLPQPALILRPPSENFNQNILKPPSLPTSQLAQQQSLSSSLSPPLKSPLGSLSLHQSSLSFPVQLPVPQPLSLNAGGLSLSPTATDKITRNRIKQDFQSTSDPTKHKETPITSSQFNNEQRVRVSQNFYNLNSELKNNEILEIQKVPQIFSAEIKPVHPLQNLHVKYDEKTRPSDIKPNSRFTPLNWQSESKLRIKNNKIQQPLQGEEPPKVVNSALKFWSTTTTINPLLLSSLKTENANNHIQFDKPIFLESESDETKLHTHFKQFTDVDSMNIHNKFQKKPNIVYLNESRLQNVNLDHYIFSHTVNVNVPPLTFKREDIDYPQLTNPSVRGQIPQLLPDKVSAATKDEIKLLQHKTSPYKYMPLIKIPANEQQVQVSLTPINIIASKAVPFKIPHEEILNKFNNFKMNKISLPESNIQVFVQDQNTQDQKVDHTKNFLQIKPGNEVNSDWKHHRKQEQQQPYDQRQPFMSSSAVVLHQSPLEQKAKFENAKYSSNTSQNHNIKHKPTPPLVSYPMSFKYHNFRLQTQQEHEQKDSSDLNKNSSSFLTRTTKTGINKHINPLPVLSPRSTAKQHHNNSHYNSKKITERENAIKQNNTEKLLSLPSQNQEITREVINDIMRKNQSLTIMQNINTNVLSQNREPFKKLTSHNNKTYTNSMRINENPTSTTNAIIIAPGEAFKSPNVLRENQILNRSSSEIDYHTKSENYSADIHIPHETQFPREQQLLRYNISKAKILSKTNIVANMSISSLRSPPFSFIKSTTTVPKPIQASISHFQPMTTISTVNKEKVNLNESSFTKANQIERSRQTISKLTETKFKSTYTASISDNDIKPLEPIDNKKHLTETQLQNDNDDNASFLQFSISISKIANASNELSLRRENPETSEEIQKVELPENRNKRRKSNEHLQPSEGLNEKMLTTIPHSPVITTNITSSSSSSPPPPPSLSLSSASILTYTTTTMITTTTTTTTTIKRVILPTKYVTAKHIYTVTTMAKPLHSSSLYVLPTSISPLSGNNDDQLMSSETTPLSITTLFLTHTQINTIIDTITTVQTKTETETETLDPVTITATKTLNKPLNTADETLQNNYKLISQHMEQPLLKQFNSTYSQYPTIEVVSNNITTPGFDSASHSQNENSIFIIMTNNKNKKPSVITQETVVDIPSSPLPNHIHLQIANVDGIRQKEIADVRNEEEEVIIEYDNAISFDDIPSRDEEQQQSFNSKTAPDISNYRITANDVSSNNHTFLGGVLIATPLNKIFSKSLYSNDSISCRPECKPTHNERCVSLDKYSTCLCRPGFARMFPDRPCKPTYTYDLRMHAERIGSYPLHYMSELANYKTEHYKHLTQQINNALDRMIMQSDIRDVFHGAHVTTFSNDNKNHNGVMFNIVLQLSDNTNAKRLEEVLRKDLRLNNYSIGGTDLYTNKDGVDALAVNDFNECLSRELHDCSENAYCFNLPATYTCSCREGFADLTENPMFPGRICSSEQIGCDVCYYHGKCSASISTNSLTKLGPERIVCECFAWYAGSKCQVNLKILLIVLLGIGTLLFILLLFCILITCTKRRKHQQHLHTVLSAPSTITSSCNDLHKTLPKSSNFIVTGVGMHGSSSRGAMNIKRQKSIKIEKRSMIKDSSSETSQNSLPCTLKEKDSCRNYNSNCTTKKPSLMNYSNKYRNYCAHSIVAESVPQNIPVDNSENLNTIISSTSSSFKANNNDHQQLISNNSNDNEDHYCEQSDRSLTVMIPRAKYHHSSLLTQTQLMHHQLTMERIFKSSKREKKSSSSDNELNIKRKHANNTSALRNTNDVCDEFPQNPGALISAGFEVSAIVNKTTSLVNTAQQPNNNLVRFDVVSPASPTTHNAIATMTSDPTTSADSKNTLSDNAQNFKPHNKLSSNYEDSGYNLYKCEKDLIESMDEWLGNVKLNELSAEARSFDETTIRATTKPLQTSIDDGQTNKIQDESNTMAERDLGSTFLLPHTHLYKSERQESELSGFDSF